MKKNLLFALLLISFSSIAAQHKISITFKDGSTLNGFGRIKANQDILFRHTEDADKEFYNSSTVKTLTIYDNDSERNFVYKTIKGATIGSIRLLQIVLVGKTNLYLEDSSGVSYGPNMAGGGSYGFTSHSKTTYYISKNQDEPVINLRIGNTYSKRFKKIAKEYFASCPDLLEKINSKYFKRYEIESVVKYYNENCEN